MFSFSRRTLSCALRRLKSVQEKSGYNRQRCRSLANLSYYHQPGTEPLLSWTLGEVVDRTADAKGDNIAVVSCHQNISKTFTEYRNDINQFAAGLVSLQLPVGSKIGIVAPNLYEWAVTQFAAAKAGLVLVNVNTAYQVSELEFCLNHTECAALIVAEKFARQDFYQMLLQIVPELERSALGQLKSARLPLLKHVILIGETSKPGTVNYDDLMESATAEHHAAMHAISSKLQFDEAINIQFTSGTTGRPKAAQLCHFNIVNNADLIGRTLGLREQDEIFCLNVPLIHCYGCVGASLAAVRFGSTTVMPAPSFNAKASLEAITKHRCTLLYGTPTMYIDMINQLGQGEYDVSSVRKGTMAGAPCPPEVVKSARTKLNARQFYIFYGTTETSPLISSTCPDEPTEEWIETVGRPFEHTEVKIVDAEDRIVPANQRGELCARGYLVFMGYFKEEGKTREVVRHNWYHTGDEARMSEDGRLTISGRIKDMIIRGGENVYPVEIEDFLYTHPDVLEVQWETIYNVAPGVCGMEAGLRGGDKPARVKQTRKSQEKPEVDVVVVGVPDKRLGEESCAWIKLKPGRTLSEEDVKSFCKGKLSHFKIPKYVLFVDAFPKTVSGKIQKHKMRDESKKILNL